MAMSMPKENLTLAANCILCTDPDDGNMITCSSCLHCFHSSCCEIDDNVDAFSWRCQSCIVAEQQQNDAHNPKPSNRISESSLDIVETPKQQPPANINQQTSHSQAVRPTISAKKQLQLQQLEEEMLLKQEYLRRKYQLLRQEDDECQEVDTVRPVGNSNRNATIKDPPCVQSSQQNANISLQRNTSHNMNSTILRRVAEQLGHDQTFQTALPSSAINGGNIYESHDQSFQTALPSSTINGGNINERQNLVGSTTHQNRIVTSCQNGINKNITNDTHTGSNSQFNRSDFLNTTATQLMARQYICKDLPAFNGDPKEWPIFISAYEHSTQAAGYTNDENLIRLQNSLRGKARDAVRNCLMLPDMVPDIIRTLKMYYGRPECIIKNLVDEVRKYTIQRGKLESLIEFSFAVKNLCATIRASHLEEYLINPTLLQELVDKLPVDTVLQWALYSKDIYHPNLLHFSDWLYMIAEATCKVTVPVFDHNQRPANREGRLNTHKPQTVQQQCIICKDPHKLDQCTKFKELSVAERWDTVKVNNLCRICLGKHRRRCWFHKQCGVNGCNVLHNSLLHNEEQSSGGVVNNHRSTESESFYRVVPVTLYSGNKSVSTYALMDDGSTLTLLEEEIADKLGVEGIKDPLCIRWTGDVTRFENNSKRLDLKISSARPNSNIFPINSVYTVKKLNLSKESLNVQDIKSKYTYLKDIPLEDYTNVVPSMIIGVNNPNLIAALKVREGGWHQPVASKTRLGWTLFGGGSRADGKLNFHKCNCDEVHELVKQFFADESMGITGEQPKHMSKDDEQAMQILSDTCVLKDGRYEVGLLWKIDPPELPDSLPMAKKRLQCIKQKAVRDPNLAEILNQQIVNLEEKGYAERLPIEVLQQNESKTWYLPTFIVKNPHKPNKFRLVWDAAAKSNDFALNDFLLKGPDLLVPLIHILFNFRMGAVAVCGDIAEMFHRILVRGEDARAQRFLWWDENDSLLVYQLNVLTFGASCSPCIAHFVRDKNASQFGNERAIEAITKQHYVDDFIASTSTIEDAIELAVTVRDVHAKGGFVMRNWSSNSLDVLKALGETKDPDLRTFANNEKVTQYEKILGLYWDPKNDVFKMNVKFVRLRRPILSGNLVPTKREVLQVLMSVFDPLGFTACFMSYLKTILQEIWRSGIDWDQPLSDDLFNKWKNWLTFFPLIAQVAIPRCYSLTLQQNDYSVELHTFVDASEDAYAAVSYFRSTCGDKVEIRLIAAKSKVAPLRPLSIPRLELQAATIGARLTKTITSHDIKLKRKIMWTDSKTVLTWLTGDPRKYKQFVMFRVAEILKFTNPSEWRWVPSAMNVADFATKFRPATDNYNEWFEGPSWLKQPEHFWPKNSVADNSNTEEIDMTEIRPNYLNIQSRKSIQVSINFEYFSSWYRLKRAVANWVRYVERSLQKFKQQEIVEGLNSSHLVKAKKVILKMTQMTGFADEYAAIQSGRPITKGGAFDKLNVYIDEDGIIRVKNRAQYAADTCGPQRDFIILPGKHHVTKLIIMDYHRAYHHLNHETVLNEIRQIYFIISSRTVYKSIRRSCQQCKIDAAKPISPQMANLPPARLGAFQRPFTFVGVDYFGPMTVTFGRKSLKRWGVVFTCLTIRAIHIEIAHSLSTDSFLMTLRNFVARRGTPAEIYSDNGTNFRGADRLLKDEVKNIEFNKVQADMAYRGISWKFNPPAAPHMGGAWERLVRSVKTILYKISPAQKFTDESLRSALMEVELIVNSRPLTYVSLETEDQEAITPNHFLLGSSNGTKPFFSPDNIDYKMCLRQSDAFANMFWRRFVKEMLPMLTRRGKWSQQSKAIEVGDVVLVVDENAVRNTWLRGKIIEVIKAKDGQVRRAKLKTMNGVMERPAVKLAVLDVGN